MTHTILINVDDGETICEECPFRTDTGCNNRGYFNCKELNLGTLKFANLKKKEKNDDKHETILLYAAGEHTEQRIHDAETHRSGTFKVQPHNL